MTTARIVSPAGLVTGIGIETEFQTFGMYVFRKRCKTGRESAPVNSKEPQTISRSCPVVVDDDIRIPCIFHTRRNEQVHHVADQFLVKIARKSVVRIPAHGRSEGQAVARLSVADEGDNEQKHE